MPTKCPMRMAFLNHKGRARHSNIPFYFSFEEWKSWWEEQLGPKWLKKRGRRSGQYVMARFGDQGAYIAGNVKCITSGENSSEAKHLQGEDHCWVKLTEAQVVEARLLYVPHSIKFGTRALAKKYGISHGAMVKALRGESWKSLGPGIPKMSRGGSPQKLTAEIVSEARRLYIPGHPERSASALARKHGVCVQTMWEVVTGKTWREAA